MVLGGSQSLKWRKPEENGFGVDWGRKMMSLLLVMLNMNMFEMSKTFHISI